MGTIDDLNSTGKNVVANLAALVTAFQAAFPRINGTFTLSNATTTVIAQTSIKANSIVLPVATNSAAALLGRVNGWYISAVVSGASFSVSTQTGTAAGTETFSYIVVNPS